MLLFGAPVALSIEKILFQCLQNQRYRPKLQILLANDSFASSVYVRRKMAKCEQLGCQAELYRVKKNTTEAALLEKIHEWNGDKSIDGILCQLPLFPHLHANNLLSQISPAKDVDGLTPQNIGLLSMGTPKFIPCTPQGIWWMLRYYNINLAKKNAVVIGRSQIVGKPMAMLLASKLCNMSVTLLHSQSANPSSAIANADLLIVATGQMNTLSDQKVQSNAVIIDVGINQVKEGKNNQKKVVGDVKQESYQHQVQAISPVPGGVGPLTITSLIYNLCLAAGLPKAQMILPF